MRCNIGIAAAVMGFLMAFALPASAEGPVGWASVAGYGQSGTTGGAGGPTVTVTTAGDFVHYVSQSGPYIIQVIGDIEVGAVNIQSNKTIVGLGTDATLWGRIGISGVRNIIIRNLNIRTDNAADDGWDAITISGSHHIWVDHCNLFNAPDGLCDITNASDFVTVSWCKFYYTWGAGHRFPMLIGHSDDATGDLGKLRVTMYNNWFAGGCTSRMPSVRYGKVHVFNNYFSSTGNNYCIRSRIEAQVLVENNHFHGVRDPHYIYITTGTTGLLKATGNIYENTSGRAEENEPENVFVPPYDYTLIPAADVRDVVMAGAGPQLPDVEDTAPPTPDPMTWQEPPAAISTTAISMTATTAQDENGVLYYFTCHTSGGSDSGWQGSPTYIDTGLEPGTTYTYSVVARDVLYNQTQPSPQVAATTKEPPTADPIKINFQPAASPVPDGYLADTGAVFADRGNGHSYGWNFDHTGETRVRNTHPDPRLDTLCHIALDGIWEIALPTGEYFVELTIGDAVFDSYATVNVEGVNYWDGIYMAGGVFATKTMVIAVNDGRLTLDQGTSGSPANTKVRLNYIIITPTAVPDEDPPTPNPMTWAVEPHAIDGTAISMTATTATDESGVEYYFENMTDNMHDSGWQESPIYVDTGLDLDSGYVYRVKARDLSVSFNETLWSEARSAVTLPYACVLELVADLDGNCQVDLRDFAHFAAAWAEALPEADLNEDAWVDLIDVAWFASEWLVCGREPTEKCWE